MPDWISHILIALIVAELFKIEKKILVVIGALLPDVFFKLELIGLIIDVPRDKIYWLFTPLHTPIGGILLIILLIPIFKYDKIKTGIYMFIGLMTHLISDLTNKHLYLGQNFLLFPFSWKSYDLNLLWPEKAPLLILPLVLVYLAIFLYKYKKITILQ